MEGFRPKVDAKGFICCHWCNKKYKRMDKIEEHVPKAHPFMTLRSNSHKFTAEERLWLLNCMSNYFEILEGIMVNPELDYFVDATKKIGATAEGHREFQRKAKESGLLFRLQSDPQNLFKAITQFEMFLNLGITWRGDNFCPSMIIDFVWHSAMLQPGKYSDLCIRFFACKMLSHCLPENIGLEEKRFAEFEAQFRHHHKVAQLSIGDLTIGAMVDLVNFNTAFIMARNTLISERDRFEELKREEEAKWEALRLKQLDQRQREQAEAAQRRDSAWVKYDEVLQHKNTWVKYEPCSC